MSTPPAQLSSIGFHRHQRHGGPMSVTTGHGADPGAALPLGAHPRSDGSTSFLVWAPAAERISVRIDSDGIRTVELEPRVHGYHAAVVNDVPPGTRYTFMMPDGASLPDPASRYQPEGVHGASEVVSAAFDWQTNSWQTHDLRDLVIYELHVGTFTKQGTFDAVIPRLEPLRDLGINAIELMPVAQFPGDRNWGYDGVFAFAAQRSYGGPLALKRLVDAAHALDIAVLLDVVYNHVGPEGNHLSSFGPYFTDTYHTPWGAALNFDEAGTDEVRRYFIESALQWTGEFRIDGLRVDAVHAILDRSARPFLRELTGAVHAAASETGRSAILIAESDLADPRVLRPAQLGGLEFDAQWLDDFHHSLRTLVTREDTGYYVDFGTLAHFARACSEGYVYAGEYSRYRRRRHGTPGPDLLPRQFIVYAQNHDQIGNRLAGDRLAASVSPAQLRLAAAAVLLSPFTPMLFMGEEYGARTPFPYFVSHGDVRLVDEIRTGRKAEISALTSDGDPPDPQAETTFDSAVIDWDEVEGSGSGGLTVLYRRLLELRRTSAGIRAAEAISTSITDTDGCESSGDTADGVIMIQRRAPDQSSVLLLNFAATPATVGVPAAGRAWRCVLDTEAPEFGGAGSSLPTAITGAAARIQLKPHSAVLLLHDET